MSNAFREIASRKQEPVESSPGKCEAYGCPCRASVSVAGGRFACSAHVNAPVEKWQEITRHLNENKWLIEFIDEMRGMEAKFQDWRGFATQFWHGSDDFCKPLDQEEAAPYQYRMRGELLWRAGVQPKRPHPRIPAEVKASGHFQRSAA
jgi:hypothetical protein